ncbi:MAG: hypothetical protein AAGB19_04675 [Cyanobacteria bacterium P01_F01_bin.3]
MAGRSKYEKLKPEVENFIRDGMAKGKPLEELRSAVSRKFSDVPGATMTGWVRRIAAKWEEEQNTPRHVEAIAVNPEAVEMPNGKIVNLRDYQDGLHTSQKRHTPKIEYGVSHYHAIVEMARDRIDNGSENARIMAGHLMLKLLYAQTELPAHVIEGTTTVDVSERTKAYDEMTAEELHLAYQKRLGNA